jgi:hypothetical protein
LHHPRADIDWLAVAEEVGALDLPHGLGEDGIAQAAFHFLRGDLLVPGPEPPDVLVDHLAELAARLVRAIR